MARRKSFAPPPRWSDAELEQDRLKAIALFKEERQTEGPRAYSQAFDASEPVVRRLFKVSRDLRAFEASLVSDDEHLLAAARFLCGPPISEDDLQTLVDDSLSRRPLDKKVASKLAEVLRSAWDPRRFPWIAEGRNATAAERETAILWTTGLWAAERARTGRRTERSKAQERRVAEALRAAKYEEVPRADRPLEIRTLDDLALGRFARETKLAGHKCDVPVRLKDGRLLAIECKVSNSAVNSVKRLEHEIGNKANGWRGAFDQVVPAAVLTGVFKAVNLAKAQDEHHVTLFWEHDLAPLQDVVRAADKG